LDSKKSKNDGAANSSPFFNIKTDIMLKFSLVFCLILSFCFSVNAQYTLNSNTSNMYIDGTSSLHDWTETVEDMSGSLNVDLADNAIAKVKMLSISIPVSSIKSGKSGMDKNTYVALNSKDYPNIKFALKSYAKGKNSLTLTGNLTISGTTKLVKIKSVYEVKSNSIEVEGKHTFKMSEFGVEPPTAMMGTIKTGDEITIRFNLVFDK
jgi:polyisoprenoid-binding protein YceI